MCLRSNEFQRSFKNIFCFSQILSRNEVDMQKADSTHRKYFELTKGYHSCPKTDRNAFHRVINANRERANKIENGSYKASGMQNDYFNVTDPQSESIP